MEYGYPAGKTDANALEHKGDGFGGNKSEYRVLWPVGGDKTPQADRAVSREYSQEAAADATFQGINPMK